MTPKWSPMTPKWSPMTPKWSPKMMSIWLYRQDFVKFSLNCHYNKRCAVFQSRRESITGERLTSFSEEDTTMPYSGFELEPTRLQAEGHIHHTGWVAKNVIDTYVLHRRSISPNEKGPPI
ncbi:hypothetical protein TNCV_2227401 [Trichonephila clavipes]|uniref:Uncharacterized protein n=1 Tax=Trichonephila clavipes TaxID=2585209 RepID=A0A8X6WFY4_TRICX|nr:hypothetical protein TNCV_2227401 [Trichonephila clavipes]